KTAKGNGRSSRDKLEEIAWGKPLGGLQAGIAHGSGAKRTYQVGEAVPLVVRIRNISDKPVLLTYRAGFPDLLAPTVEDESGKRTPTAMPKNRLAWPLIERSINPREMVDIGIGRLKLDPVAKDGKVTVPTLCAGLGTFKLSYSGFVKGNEE